MQIQKKKGKFNMLIPTIIMGVIAAVLVSMGYFRSGGEHLTGLKSAGRLTIEILPLLFFAFIVAGMTEVLLPRELISRWVGSESGFRGILIGTVAGALAPGGPYVSLPIAAGFLKAGASVGTMVAFVTGWSLWAVGRLPMEVRILGWKFTLIRLGCTFFFPPIAGWIAQVFFASSMVK